MPAGLHASRAAAGSAQPAAPQLAAVVGPWEAGACVWRCVYMYSFSAYLRVRSGICMQVESNNQSVMYSNSYRRLSSIIGYTLIVQCATLRWVVTGK